MHLGLRNLGRHPLRSLLSVAGIAVAAALLADMVMLRGGLEESFASLLLRRGYQVRVTPAGTLPLDSEATLRGVTALRQRIEADPGVVAVAPVVAAALHAVHPDGRTRGLFGYGIDPLAQGMYDLLEGADLAPGDSTGVLLGEPARALLGAAPGDTIVVTGGLDPQLAGSGLERRLVVRGIVLWLYDARDQPSVGTLIGTMQALAGLADGDRASLIMVRVREGDDIPAVVTRLRSVLPGTEVSSVADLVEHLSERMVYFRQLALILGTVSVVVTTLLVATLLTITVNERLAEIATLRAIGVSRAGIVRMVLLEGLALVTAGGVLGVLLGLATARVLDGILTTFPGLPAAFSFFVPRPAALARALVLTLALGAAAALVPAWRAARAPIAGTLRSEAT